ncbi:hypothetical protein BH23ACT4_BH23ACT4_03450 [soil metagenome]
MLVEQTPVGRSYRFVARLVTSLVAYELRGGGRQSFWFRRVRVMLVEQTPVGRSFRSVERLT